MAGPPKVQRRSYRRPILGFLLFVILPTVAAAAYYYRIHVDRYVSEFRYSVRGGAVTMSSGESGLEGGGATGAVVFAADSFVLEDYLTSVQAFEDIERRLPLREMLGKDGGDPVRRYDPTFAAEDMTPFWRRAVNVRFDAITGITTAEVSLYAPEDALAVSQALVDELQKIVNGLTKEAREEMLAYVNDQFAIAEANLDAARERIETFRRENRTFSPQQTVSIESQISGDLTSKLTAKRVEMRTLLQRAPNSPRVQSLADEIEALVEQLIVQYESRAEGEDGQTIAGQLSAFQELQERYDIARQTYVNTFQLKQQAEANAALNQAQLVVFVKPRLPTRSIDPNRPLEIGIFFGIVFLGWVAVRVFLAGLATQ